ncbi:MAG: hypothetical protein ACXADH_18330, partial [Candidatus Kariarchaeaceae archaeon]
TIANNKEALMEMYPTVSNDVYNRLSQIAYGIMGQESTFGTYGGARGTLGYYKDVVGSEILDKNMTVGVAQIRLSSIREEVRKEFGINSTSDLYKVRNSAIGTMAILMDTYVNNIPAAEKGNFETLVPLYYNNPAAAKKAIKEGKTGTDNKYVQNVLNYADDVTVYLGEGFVDSTLPIDVPTDNDNRGNTLIMTPLLFVRRKRKNNEAITDEDIQDLKDYRDELIAKINKLKAESGAATNPAAPAKPFTETDIDDAFGSVNLDKSRGRLRFEKLSPKHREKAKIADDWYASHPLSKYFPVANAMKIVNSNAYATWTSKGIVLWNGASYTDIYHEAWHGFSQFFLTREDKADLYNEVVKTAAGKKALKEYAKTNGRTVDSVTESEMQWVMEELIAEDFRKYMLSGGKKTIKSRPERNSIFRRIYNALKWLFQGFNLSRPAELSDMPKIKELYDNLRLMKEEDLIKYSPSELNVMPGWRQLNKGIQPFAENSTVKINYADSNLIVESIDSIMSSVIIDQIDKKGPAVASVLYTQPERILPSLYKRVRTVLQDKLDTINEEREGVTDVTTAKQLEVQANILSFAIEEFGTESDWKDAMANETETDLEGPMETTWQKASNQFSMRELAGSQVKAILHGAKKYDENGKVQPNRLGFDKLIDFGIAFSTIVTLTKGIDDPSVMRDRMIKASVHLPNKWIYNEVLKKLGPVKTYDRSSFSLWTNFWQAFYKADIPLDQLNVTEVFERTDGGQKVRAVKVLFGRPQAVFRQAEYKFTSDFKTVKDHKYIKPNANGENVLDVYEIEKEFGGEVKGREYEFLHAIGIPVSSDEKVINEIKDLVNINALYDKIISINDKVGAEITDIVYALRNPYEYGTPGVIMGGPSIKQSIGSESTNLNTILDIHTRYSGEFPNVSVRNP